MTNDTLMPSSPLPELLTELFRESNLSLPPLPPDLALDLEQVDACLFASDPNWYATLPPVLTFDVFGPRAAIMTETDEDTLPLFLVPDSFLLCGFRGHGIQSWYYRYILFTPNCGLAIEMPFGGAYSDHAENATEIERGYALVKICLAATQDGLTHRGHDNARLYLVIASSGLNYRLLGAHGELLETGDSLPPLLDILGSHLDKDTASALSPNAWLRV